MHMEVFPTEILLKVFDFLPIESAINCSIVCKRWYSILNDHYWKHRYDKLMIKPKSEMLPNKMKCRYFENIIEGLHSNFESNSEKIASETRACSQNTITSIITNYKDFVAVFYDTNSVLFYNLKTRITTCYKSSIKEPFTCWTLCSDANSNIENDLLVYSDSRGNLESVRLDSHKQVSIRCATHRYLRCMCTNLARNTIFVTGGRDSLVCVYETNSFDGPIILEGHDNSVHCVVSSDDLVISGSYDNFIKIWSIRECCCLFNLSHHADKIYYLTLSTKEYFWKMVSSSFDRSLSICSINQYSPSYEFVQFCHQYDSLPLKPIIVEESMHGCDWLIVCGSADKSIKVWNGDNGTCIGTFIGHRASVKAVVLCLNRYVVSGDHKGEVIVWDLLKLRKVGYLTHFNYPICDIVVIGNIFAFTIGPIQTVIDPKSSLSRRQPRNNFRLSILRLNNLK